MSGLSRDAAVDRSTGGGSEDAIDSAPSCTHAFLEAGSGRLGDAEVPIYHRTSPSCCPSARGEPSGQPYASGYTDGCSTDSECTDGSDGRCFPFEGLIGPGGCSYDQCFTDSNCPAAAPCICRMSASDLTANSCATPGNCALDSECGPGGFCSPSLGPCDYPASSQSALAGAAYYCHTASDTCSNDTDCSPAPGDAGEGCPLAQACVYDTQARHWSCVSDRCCLP